LCYSKSVGQIKSQNIQIRSLIEKVDSLEKQTISLKTIADEERCSLEKIYDTFNNVVVKLKEQNSTLRIDNKLKSEADEERYDSLDKRYDSLEIRYDSIKNIVDKLQEQNTSTMQMDKKRKLEDDEKRYDSIKNIVTRYRKLLN